jgi:hypothetical protein
LSVALLGFAVAEPTARAVAAEEDEVAATEVLLQMKLERGDKVLRHPGHMMETGSEVTLVLTQGERTHEVAVLLERAADKRFNAKIRYSDGGKAVLSGTTTFGAKQWTTVKSKNGKAKVSIRIDPDAKRVDGVELPDGDAPLDGL